MNVDNIKVRSLRLKSRLRNGLNVVVVNEDKRGNFTEFFLWVAGCSSTSRRGDASNSVENLEDISSVSLLFCWAARNEDEISNNLKIWDGLNGAR